MIVDPTFFERWQRTRDTLVRAGALVDPGRLIDDLLADLAETSNATNEPVSLPDAADACGYSADHLSRLIRQGKLKNYGRKHAPRVRVSECPRKRADLPKASTGEYDLLADARSLRVRRM